MECVQGISHPLVAPMANMPWPKNQVGSLQIGHMYRKKRLGKMVYGQYSSNT